MNKVGDYLIKVMLTNACNLDCKNKRCNCEFSKELIIFSLFNYDKQQSCNENLKEFISGKSKNYILDLKERRSWNELFRNK